MSGIQQKLDRYPFLVYLPVILTGMIMISLGWRKWPDILIDFGRELYVPWQLSEGKVLYRDIAYFRGPFSAYFNAFLFRVFSPGVITLAAANFLLAMSLFFGIDRIFRKAYGRLAAFIAGMSFVSVFAFSQYVKVGNYNFLSPYSHELTHGIIFSVLLIYVYSVYLDRKKDALWAVIGLIYGIVALTKLEVTIALTPAVLLGLVGAAYRVKMGVPGILKISGYLVIGAAVPMVLFSLYLSRYMPLSTAVPWIFFQFAQALNPNMVDLVFYMKVAGRDDVPGNLMVMMKCLGAYAGILAFFGAGTYALKKTEPGARTLVTAAAAIIAAGMAFFLAGKYWAYSLRPMALVLGVYSVSIAARAARVSRNGGDIKKELIILVFSVFACFLLIKIVLNTNLYHYGFALAMPGFLVMTAILAAEVPTLAGRYAGAFFEARVWVVAFLAALLFQFAVSGSRYYGIKDYTVGSGGDAVVTYSAKMSSKGYWLGQFIKFHGYLMPEKATVTVFPEGIMLNYMTRKVNPTGHIDFIPPEVIMFSEEVMLSTLKEKSPDYAVIMDRNTKEYGSEYFGRDYAKELGSWIDKNYTDIFVFGKTPLKGKGFGILVKKRNDIPDDASSLNKRGELYVISGNGAEALSLFSAAIKLDPSYGKTYYNSGYAYYKAKDYAKAVENFRKAIEIDPGDLKAEKGLRAAEKAASLKNV
ncbi:MAG: tetratricopeptide repeat protein [Candidatus Omnitrophica bacterium]|nr:tetratricopeptide repeat protein [Candidatus Omnitrophota bacterium]